MEQRAGPDSPLDGVRVLLVEDHAMVREVISQLLVESGAAVIAAAGVPEAPEAFERERPDVVLSPTWPREGVTAADSRQPR